MPVLSSFYATNRIRDGTSGGYVVNLTVRVRVRVTGGVSCGRVEENRQAVGRK